MSSNAASEMPANTVEAIQPFQGGRKVMLGAAGAGLVLLLLTFAGLAVDAQRTMFSYLVAYTYWAGLGMASLILLMMFHAFGAKWMVVFRRPLEAMATTVGLFALLFVPIAAGMKHLYIWVDPPASLGREALEVLHHKHAYLNPTAFLMRAAIYFVVLVIVSGRLFRLSTKQDQTGDIALTRRQRVLGTGAIPLLALVLTFAAFDWLMSLNPLWFSTIFGVYYFAGSMVGTFALLALVTHLGRGKNLFGDFVSVEHTHNIGKLMLTFTAFWGYIGFSQFMLIWIANLPEEVPFFIVRLKGEWAWVGVLLIFGQFFIPFGALLSRSRKRDRRQLAAVAIWILLIHYVDIYWLVIPTLSPESFGFHWTSLTAFLGIGLCAVSFTVWRLRGNFTVPVRDPYLSDSLRYRQP
jgi:hypothetical protein